jgi:hypothetical protein
VLNGVSVGARQGLQKTARRASAELGDRHSHRGERGRCEARDRDVVEPRHGKILRNPHVAFLEGGE